MLENSSNLKPIGYSCCDNCASKCQCYPGCLRSDFKLIEEGNHKEAEEYEKQRSATKEQIVQLKEELEQYRDERCSFSVIAANATFPNIAFQFTDFHISQIFKNCEILFSIDDILKHIGISRAIDAIKVLEIIYDRFKDFEFHP